ncbi:anti-repressor SinI family protein [Halobacillus sp. K22]
MSVPIVAKIDKEWLELMKQARKLGLSVEDVKQFLEKKKSPF